MTCKKADAEYVDRGTKLNRSWLVYCTACDWSSDPCNVHLPTKTSAQQLFKEHQRELDTALPYDMQIAIQNLRTENLIQ